MKNTEKWQITLGDLVVALTDEVAGQGRDEKKTYALVSFILADLFKDAKAPTASERSTMWFSAT